jgi:hypothetical protein
MDINQPYFYLFPLNNSRTGYKPYSMPVVYIERHRTTNDGLGIENSEFIRLRYYIVDAPEQAKVAGPFNTNLRVPDTSIFDIELTKTESLNYIIKPLNFVFYRKSIESDGTETYAEISYEEAENGDYFEYRLNDNNVVDKVPFYKDAYYYDLSNIKTDVSSLPKPKRYLFVWETVYFKRYISVNGELKCISDEVGLTTFPLEVNHPGEVHEAFYRGTPNLYFNYEGFNIKDDKTLEFYRPFTDVLQDIFDEQDLLDGINQIDFVPVEYIPYLSYLIGWDLPNYPGVSDNLRRQILKRAVYLQKLKGSRRVIQELFDLFGFTINIFNLWANKEGTALLGDDSGLESSDVLQVDVAIADYDASGFGEEFVPLVSNITKDSEVVLYAYQVENGSEAYTNLTNFFNTISNDLNSKNDNTIRVDSSGAYKPNSIIELEGQLSNGLIGYTRVVVGERTDELYGRTIINHNNIKYDRVNNVISLKFDHDLSVDGGKVFIFPVYISHKLEIPSELTNTITNKFDVEILQKNDLKVVDFNIFLFLLNFLFKLKAFHSILRKIKLTTGDREVYNVNDCCLSGVDINTPGTCLGDLQVPPAVLVDTSDGCKENTDYGYKDDDLLIRQITYNGMLEEFNAWKNLRTKDEHGNIIGENCSLTKDGQDRVLDDGGVVDFDHNEDTRPNYCEKTNNNPNYCFKGRVEQTITVNQVLSLIENHGCSLCIPSMGKGSYWEEYGVVNIGNQNKGMLHDRLSYLNNPQNSILHFIDSVAYTDDSFGNNTIALNPINLGIEKDNLCFPSHRFLSMNAIKYDHNYTETNITDYDIEFKKKRPWDINLQCGYFNNELNAILNDIGESVYVELSSGLYYIYKYDQYDSIASFPDYSDVLSFVSSNGYKLFDVLTWDTEDLVYASNGLDPEIESLSTHNITDPTKIVTHNIQIYTPSSHIAITDEFDHASSNRIDLSTVPTGKIFNSVCVSENTDFSGGYPSKWNNISISGNYRYDDIDPNGYIDRPSIASGLEMPLGVLQTSASYFGRSMLYARNIDPQYQYYIPYRMDCGCSVNDCDPTGDVTYSDDIPGECDNILYDDSKLDSSCDRLSVETTAIFMEYISTCSRISNNDLVNLFCINDECSIPSSGSFKYKDSYDVVYEASWQTTDDVIDITFINKDPRIPGQPDDGYVKDNRIFRKGIITESRKLIRYNNTTSYIEYEGSRQYIDYFQINSICNDDKFEDPFSYHINCSTHDTVDFIVTSGPRWIDPEESTTGPIVWYDSSSPSSDYLMWMDPYAPDVPWP